MHVSDGVLPPAVWLGGMAAAALSVGLSLRRFEERAVPRLAVLTSLFFVASLIHVPLGLTSVHLMLNGLLGIVLGALSLPAVLVALFFQAVFLGHGGLTTLGVNTMVLGSGALAARYVFTAARGSGRGPRRAAVSAFAATLAAVLVSGATFFAVMALGGESLARVAAVTLLPHAIVAVADGVVAASAVSFLVRVKPELLPGGSRPAPDVPARSPARVPIWGMAAVAGLACAFAPRDALAHSLRATARSENGIVTVLVFFSDHEPAAEARVRVTLSDGSGGAVASGATDIEGKFRFPCPQSADMLASIDDGAGHHVELAIPAALCRLGPGVTTPREVHSEEPILGWIGNTWARVAAGIGAIVLVSVLAIIIIRATRHGRT